jgi:hypothetical protein
MTYSFHPDAERELNASVDYYEECQVNLGVEFAYEVQKNNPKNFGVSNCLAKIRWRDTKMFNESLSIRCYLLPKKGRDYNFGCYATSKKT